jgi:hypothetical protein
LAYNDIAFFEALKNLDAFATDDADAHILTALAIALFDDDKATSLKGAYGLWWEPKRFGLAFERDDDLGQITDVNGQIAGQIKRDMVSRVGING